MSHFCTACGQHIGSRPMTVDAIIARNGRILLIKRSGPPYQGYWALPGGFVDQNESLEEAMMRETKEETGLRVQNYELLGIYSDPNRHPKQLIAACFTVQVEGNAKAGDDAGDLKYVSIENLPGDIAFDHRRMISDFLKKYGKHQ